MSYNFSFFTALHGVSNKTKKSTSAYIANSALAGCKKCGHCFKLSSHAWTIMG